MKIKPAILFSAVLQFSCLVNYADRYIAVEDTLPIGAEGDTIPSDTILIVKSGETIGLYTGTQKTGASSWGVVLEGRYAGQSEWYIENLKPGDSLMKPSYYIDGPAEARVRYIAAEAIPQVEDVEAILFVSGTADEAIAPSNGVVIPTDAVGDVEVVLESSADQINWVSALPGLYDPGTVNRFFRLRAMPTAND